jgi:tRNA U34 2-thiouridine synthase MnmA/TrmU
VKFNSFKNFVKDQLNIDQIATGHYARLYNQDMNSVNVDSEVYPQLHTAVDEIKDQTYFLSLISVLFLFLLF